MARHNGTDPVTIDFHRDGTLKQRHRYDQPTLLGRAQDNSLNTSQSTVLNQHPAPCLEVRPRLEGDPGVDDRLDSSDLVVATRCRHPPNTHNPKDTRSGQNRHPAVIQIKTAEEITRK